ncbi:outer membrane protein assembly factor BamC [Thalassotalea aquiviva]|uniref:outer membrane protein assembly factor BamC n=1 Tax=Thalassotalea aquiviva TaxID=3242415 RepID=UPI00352A6641
MDRRIFLFSLMSLSLAACSSYETRKQANGEFNYVDLTQGSTLTIPENLDKPDFNDTFYIPDVTKQDQPVGQAVDIRAPALALPTATGSRVDEFDKTATIWFDKVDDNRDLKQLVVQAITDYLDEHGVALIKADEQNNTFESDWVKHDHESGSLFWNSVEASESWRFKYSLLTKPHGRSIGLNVDLIDYVLKSDEGLVTNIDPIEQSRVEMAMVNDITTQLGYIYRVNNREDRIARANMKLVKYGQSKNGQPALIIDYPVEQYWNYIPSFFEKYGFKVTDLNEDKFIYQVYYTKPETGVWDSIFGDELPVVELEDGTYEFHLQPFDGKTALVISDDQNNVLSEELLLDNFDILEPALSFKE